MNARGLLAHYEYIGDAPETIKRLRRFILYLAVRGKLVPQNPGDEPASELLKQVTVKKERLLKAGKIRKPRVFIDNMDLFHPFDIPNCWQWVRLDTIGAIIGGGTPSASDADNFTVPGAGIPWLTPADLGGHSELSISHGARDLSEKGFRSSSATLMPATTVLFTSRAPIGYVAIAANPISTNQGFKSIVPYIPDCSQFIALVMKSFAPEIDAMAPGTTFKEVSGKSIARVSFPLPPLAEQHRIVAKVNELLVLCNMLEAARSKQETTRNRLTAASFARLNETNPETFQDDARSTINAMPTLTTRADQIKQLRQTILNLAVRGKLVPQNLDDEPASELLKQIAMEKAMLVKAGKIRKTKRVLPIDNSSLLFGLPPGWIWSRLGGISRKIHYGFTASANQKIDRVRLLRITDIKNNKVGWHSVPGCEIDEKALPNFKLEIGDILVARTGGTIGKSFLVTELPVLSVFASYLIRVQVFHIINVRYLKLVFESLVYWVQLQEGARGAGQPNVNGQTLGKMLIPLPPLAEQHRIVAKVDKLMSLCDRLETDLTMSEDIRLRLLETLLHEELEPSAKRV